MAAKRVFADKGFHLSWVADIVKEAGIARGTFYLYFKSKQDVFSALLDDTFASLRKRLVPILLDEPEQIMGSLLDNIDRVKSFFTEEPQLARIIMGEAMSLDSGSSELVQDMRQALAMWLSALIRQWQDAGILKNLDADIVSRCFVGSIRELIEHSLADDAAGWDADRTTEVLMSVYLFGLIAPQHKQLAGEHLEDIGRPDISPLRGPGSGS